MDLKTGHIPTAQALGARVERRREAGTALHAVTISTSVCDPGACAGGDPLSHGDLPLIGVVGDLVTIRGAWLRG